MKKLILMAILLVVSTVSTFYFSIHYALLEGCFYEK